VLQQQNGSLAGPWTSSTVVQDVAVLLLLITPLLLTTFYQRRDPAIHFCRPQVPYMPLRAASLAVLSLIFAVPSRGGGMEHGGRPPKKDHHLQNAVKNSISFEYQSLGRMM